MGLPRMQRIITHLFGRHHAGERPDLVLQVFYPLLVQRVLALHVVDALLYSVVQALFHTLRDNDGIGQGQCRTSEDGFVIFAAKVNPDS